MDIARTSGRTSWSRSCSAACITLSCLVWLCSAAVVHAAGGAERLNINLASAAELAQSLPGIGPVKASRIVEHRQISGAFETIEALIDVKGIGPGTLNKLRDLITVGVELESRAEAREAMVTDSVRRVIARAKEP